jgi:hypothetical protein
LRFLVKAPAVAADRAVPARSMTTGSGVPDGRIQDDSGRHDRVAFPMSEQSAGMAVVRSCRALRVGAADRAIDAPWPTARPPGEWHYDAGLAA